MGQKMSVLDIKDAVGLAETWQDAAKQLQYKAQGKDWSVLNEYANADPETLLVCAAALLMRLRKEGVAHE